MKNLYSAPLYLNRITELVNPAVTKSIHEQYGESISVFSLELDIDKLFSNWLEEYEERGGIVISIDSIGNETIIFNSLEHDIMG